MRLNTFFSLGLLACMSGAGSLGLAGCTAKTDVAPDEPCGTLVTVRLCPGKTLLCSTEHTTLVLPDGTRLRPNGPLWDAYLPHQHNGAVLRIGYRRGAALPAGEVGDARATITCLEETTAICGLPREGGN
jgi:hypothetical protein